MAPSSFGKQTANCESPQGWLMSLAMDLAALCDMWRWNGTNGSHFPVFSEDVTFSHHFVATRPPPPSHTIGVLVVSAMPVKKLSKMTGNPASYPVYSRYNELLWIASYRFVEKYVQAAPIILEIYWIKYFKFVLLNICNSAYKTPFANPVTNNGECYIKLSYKLLTRGPHYHNSHIISFVTWFRKTDQVVTFGILRNTVFKYSNHCSCLVLDWSHARYTA